MFLSPDMHPVSDGDLLCPIFIFCRHGCPHPASSSFLLNTVAHLHDLRRDGEKSVNELVARIYRPRLKFRCPIYDGCDDGIVVGDGGLRRPFLDGDWREERAEIDQGFRVPMSFLVRSPEERGARALPYTVWCFGEERKREREEDESERDGER
ncbi:glycosyl hydrolase superfamily protein [Striga asiatica]|uniref:Glycosyl hydrolase superfamily protein n=1 Tax=Striga asiatica TaxID=4170 RepID=A0A5A7QHD8_STRAF|nr:glycosyl hydrolase superfamily protein [Striga asiatica]